MKKKRKLPSGYKLFAKTYFIFQYLIVRTLLFGFVGEPSLLQIYNGFRVSEIVAAALNFHKLFLAAFAVEHYLQMIFVFIPLALSFLWACRYVLLYAFALYQLIQYILGCLRVSKDKNNLSTNKQVTVRNGAPGDGKTRLTVYEIVYLASVMWLRLRYLYWRDKSRVEKWRRTGNTEALKDFKEVEDSYLYYTTPQTVNGKEVLPLPCLFSNIGIVNEDGLYSSKLTFEHLSQKSRPPSYTIEFIDEWGTAFDLEMSQDKPLEISDRARFIRQWFENLMFGTEQDAKNTFIDMRRVVARNDFMQGCKDYLKPLPLVLLFKLLQGIFAKTQRGSKAFSPFMSVLEKLIRSTGFVRFLYRPEGNTEHKQLLNGLVNFTIPAYSNSRYDSRAFRRLNACASLPVSGEVHTELTVEETTQNRLDWLRAEMTAIESETKETQREAAFWDLEALKDQNAKYRTKYPDKYKDYLSRR